MSDIVERLRFCEHYEWSPLMHEAANEIERLRAALQRIADDGKNCTDYCRRQARAALEPKP